MGQWHRVKAFLWVLLLGVLSSPAQSLATDMPGPIIISAAASLTNVMQSLGKNFEERHPDVKITFNFGATGALLAQMSQGAPVDVFASASVKHMDQAQQQGLIAVDSRRIFAGNTLVLAKPRSSSIPLTGLGDLTSPHVERIGIGKPETVPAGQYGKEALLAAGLWTAVEGKLIFGNSVRQVLDYLRRGEVDAALIYATDAKIAKEQIVVVTDLPGNRILYPIALVKTTNNRKGAMLFLNYLTTDSARAILEDHGFSMP
ncbi:MAG: molybdate ABC transporter substrate-binding protein [Desulfobulbaceae bacterium]|nr:molybdate ABC transporter substrate-binding protein [Desulfobulbaceae bacterium]